MDSLINSGATGYLFIKRNLAFRLSRRLGAPITITEDEATVRGFDSSKQRVKEVIILSITLASKHYRN